MLLEEQKDIDKIISSNNFKFNEKSFIYTFTNENMKLFLETLEIKSKNILSVVGSGDMFFNLLLEKNNVDLFDINLYAYYFLLLKKACIESLDYDEFLYFLIKYENNFDKSLFKKISKNWNNDEKVLEFFYNLFFKYPSSNYIKATNLFVNNGLNHRQEYVDSNIYLQVDKYYKLKKILKQIKKINFYHGDLSDIEIKELYDYIYISNIPDYLFEYRNKTDVQLVNMYNKLLSEKLNENGKIVAYLFDGKIARRTINLSKLKKQDIKYSKDKILIYEKGV